MRLAIDACVSPKIESALRSDGHLIVARAQDGEADEDFLIRSIVEWAEAIVSADRCFAQLCHGTGLHWIRFHGSVCEASALRLIRARINECPT